MLIKDMRINAEQVNINELCREGRQMVSQKHQDRLFKSLNIKNGEKIKLSGSRFEFIPCRKICFNAQSI
jgi:hypothetical protein